MSAAVAAQWRMPNSAIGRLNQTGFLYLQHPATREHVNVTVVCEAVKGNNTDRLIVPFHIEADLSVCPQLSQPPASTSACTSPDLVRLILSLTLTVWSQWLEGPSVITDR